MCEGGRTGSPREQVCVCVWGGGGGVEFNVGLRPQRPYGLLGTGSPGRPPPRLSHTGPELWSSSSLLLYVHRDHKDYWARVEEDPRTFTSTCNIAPELCRVVGGGGGGLDF